MAGQRAPSATLVKLTGDQARIVGLALLNDVREVYIWCVNCGKKVGRKGVVWTEVVSLRGTTQFFYGLEPSGRSESAAYTCLCSECSRWFCKECRDRGIEVHSIS